MSIITIRNLDEETKDRLRQLAAWHRRSMEAEIRDILRYSVRGVAHPAPEPCPLSTPEEEAPVAANHRVPGSPDPDDPALPELRARFADMNRQFEELGLSPVELPEIFQLK